MERQEFLERVRRAAVQGQAYRPAVTAQPDDAGYVGGGDDPCGRLAEQIQAAGGQAHLVDDLAAARRALNDLLATFQPRQALCWRHSLLDQLQLADLLAEHGCRCLDETVLRSLPPEEQRQAMLAAEVGITSCTWAVAETGSLVMASQPGRERLASLAPPRHVAVVSADQVLGDLFDVFARLQALPTLPSNVAFITGPSKTGDLELKLTTGVHGPKEWFVIISRQPAAAPQ